MEMIDEALWLFQATVEITTSLDPVRIPSRAVEALHRFLKFPVVSIALLSPESGTLGYVASLGLPEEIKARGFRKDGTAYQVLASREAIFVENTGVDLRVDPRSADFRLAYACLPIYHGETCYGILFVNFNEPHVFPEMERILLSTFSRQLAIALDNAHLHQELKEAHEQVRTLTGLVPICAYCKQVRSDEGFWQNVETYLHERASVRFSHGVCPNCVGDVRKELDQLQNDNVRMVWGHR